MDDLEPRDLFAMFAMAGLIIGGNQIHDEIPKLSYDTADAMLEARKPIKAGLPTIKRKPRK